MNDKKRKSAALNMYYDDFTIKATLVLIDIMIVNIIRKHCS